MVRKQASEARTYLAVGLGAGIGAVLRFSSTLIATSLLGISPLFATGFVNVVGSFIIVAFATLTGPEGRFLIRPNARQFVMGGFCGGLTTFSGMSLDTFQVLQTGDIAIAAVYLVAVLGLSLGAGWLGFAIAVRLNHLTGDKNAAA